MNPETLLRAVEVDAHRRLTEHEAAHAAAALLLGLPVDGAEAPFLTLADTEDGDPNAAAGQVLIRRRDDDDGRRKMAIALLCGPLENARSGWPPSWPLSDEPTHGDERDLVDLVKSLGLDRAGYSRLVQDALELAGSRPFERLRLAISHALETHGRLDAIALRRIKALSEEKDMEHTTKAATVTATDSGEFTAIAAAYSIDRQRDQIIRGAFGASIDRWRASGKRLPLHWNHEGDAANVIGWIDPATMRETSEGLRVSGKLDIHASTTAREAWRSMKNGTMSLSFGYVAVKSQRRDDGINELHELDLFEISIVPAPANADTRILSMKSAGNDDLGHVRDEWRDQLTAVLNGPAAPAATKSLRARADKAAREHAPIQVAEFPC